MLATYGVKDPRIAASQVSIDAAAKKLVASIVAFDTEAVAAAKAAVGIE